MKIQFILTCAVLCFFVPTLAQKANIPPPTSTTSTIETVRKNGLDFIVTTNRKFNFVSLYSGEANDSLLLLEETRAEFSREVEGINSAMKIEAWIGKGKPNKKAWTIKTEADVAEADAPFYKLTKYGCCASVNVHSWHNLLSGQKVFTGTNNLLKISVPNTGGEALDRYVVFHSNQGATETPEMKRGQDVLGVLQYGTNKRVTHRIILRSADAEMREMGDPQVGAAHQKETQFAEDYTIKDIALWAYDGKNAKTSLSDFTVILKWEDKVQIVIPFKNDAPMLGEATVPAKIKLEIPVNAK
jgi:hypothetical protein